MALATDIDGWGLSNKAHHKLRTFKEQQGNAVAIHFTVKVV